MASYPAHTDIVVSDLGGDFDTPAEERDHEKLGVDHIENEKVSHNSSLEDVRARVLEYYGRSGGDGGDAEPAKDIDFIFEKVIEMTDERAVEILRSTIKYHAGDPNFLITTLEHLKRLVDGPQAAELSQADWSLEVRAEAAAIYYHSPYPEVRSVTDPFDDPTVPCETLRAYFLGLVFMCGATSLNTCESRDCETITHPRPSLLAPPAVHLDRLQRPPAYPRPHWPDHGPYPARLGLYFPRKASLAQPGPLDIQGTKWGPELKMWH